MGLNCPKFIAIYYLKKTKNIFWILTNQNSAARHVEKNDKILKNLLDGNFI